MVSIILGAMASKPMTWQAFFVLTALADGPRHGYGIVREVATLSKGQVHLKIGSLYGLLDRDEPHDGRLRRYYRLTRDGWGALEQETELRAATAHVARAKLSLPRPELGLPRPDLGFPRPETAG
jgi:DNA-binding PadR family transcriptional regulator